MSVFQVAGVGISLLGVLALIGRGDLGVLLDLDLNRGDVLLLGAYTSWSFCAVCLRKAPRGVDPRVMLFLLLALGAAQLLPFYMLETIVDRSMVAGEGTLINVFVLAIFSSVIAIFLWNHALGRIGVGRASIFIHLIVVFTVILAILYPRRALRMVSCRGRRTDSDRHLLVDRSRQGPDLTART